jgi:hypothetical protein
MDLNSLLFIEYYMLGGLVLITIIWGIHRFSNYKIQFLKQKEFELARSIWRNFLKIFKE